MSHIETPTAQELIKVAAPVLETATTLLIDSPMMYEMAGDELKTIKAKAKELEEQRKSITGPMDVAKKRVMDLYRKPLEMLEQAESAIKRSMLTYTTEQRRIAAEEQAKVNAAAEAERQRMAKEAAEAEKAGDVATSIALSSAAEMVTAHSVNLQPNKVAGITTTTRWSAEVHDKVAYLKHVIENPDLLDSVEIHMPTLNKMASALKDKMNIPGVRPVSNESLSARATA